MHAGAHSGIDSEPIIREFDWYVFYEDAANVIFDGCCEFRNENWTRKIIFW